MKYFARDNLKSFISIILILAVYLFISAPVMNVSVRKSLDFSNHYRRALELPAETTDRAVGHILFHAVVKAYHLLLPIASKEVVLFLSIMTFMLPLPVIIFALLKKTAKGLLPDVILGALALGLTIAGPITIWIDNPYMIGYVNSIIYHNPTLIALRLFVVPLSLLSMRTVTRRNYCNFNHRFFLLLAAASIVMLATLSKPSYTIALLPGLVLYVIWQQLRGRQVDWTFLIWGLCIPGGIVLAIEYVYVFGSGFQHGGTIMFGPLKFMNSWIPNWRIPIQLVLSIVFPIGVYLLYFAEARRNLYLNISWTVFGIGAMYLYLLYQDGVGFKSGNFLWSTYSTVFVLMFASISFLIDQYVTENDRRDISASRHGLRFSVRASIALFLFACHVLSGLAVCVRFLNYPE